MTASRVGIIGLGLVGSSVARGLQPQVEVVGVDPDPDTMAAAESAGIAVVAEVSQLSDCDAILQVGTALPVVSLIAELEAEHGKPVIASMGSVAASGGFWISTSSDQIWAYPSTITGSIGVGGFLPTFERALEYVGINEDGVSTVDITTSVAESLTEKDKALFQMGTDLVYEKFISKVADNRGVTKEEIDKIARGKVWIGSKALEIGLIDEIGGIDRAIELAAELAEINEEDLGVKRISRDREFDSFFAGMTAKISSSIVKITGLDFLYKRNGIVKNGIVNEIEESLNELSMLNDPNGIYMKCFCELD